MNLKTVITTDANEREKAYAIRCKVITSPIVKLNF